MTGQRPLDAFASDDAARSEPADVQGVFRWAPSGAPCDRCGETVERRWRDGRRYVCPTCKEW